MLLDWEETMETDTDRLFRILNRDEPARVPTFREATHKQTTFRYLSFSKPNFGICWTIIGDLFVFTSSGESMLRIIEKLQ